MGSKTRDYRFQSYLHYIPVPCHNDPGCLAAINTLKRTDDKSVLCGACCKIMLCTDHDKMNTTEIEIVPACKIFKYLSQ